MKATGIMGDGLPAEQGRFAAFLPYSETIPEIQVFHWLPIFSVRTGSDRSAGIMLSLASD